MKKRLAILLLLVVCLLLTACGQKENPEHAYIMSLLEEGEYDMAIHVIEGIRDKETGSVAEISSTQTDEISDAAPETPEPERSQEETAPAESSLMQLAETALTSFMEEKGKAMSESYAQTTAMVPKQPIVIQGTEYLLGNFDGFQVHFLLLWLEMGVEWTNETGMQMMDENLCLLIDLDTGITVDTTMIEDSFFATLGDSCDTIEQVRILCLNAYHSSNINGESQIWSDAEIRKELTADQLASLTDAIA